MTRRNSPVRRVTVIVEQNGDVQAWQTGYLENEGVTVSWDLKLPEPRWPGWPELVSEKNARHRFAVEVNRGNGKIKEAKGAEQVTRTLAKLLRRITAATEERRA
ncbi:hypothetical protein [Sphaerisporangium aureirubrum]|uniref:Uncharacterized protein n=1 Tax=Sphaerisporangium aureirubrum TaxID=1544736 RepID=A0ABW1NEL4_9ACTN